METNEKSMDRRARMDMDAEVAALVGGADLEKIVEKAICAQVFGLLREAGADERRRYKALAELQKFAKLLEQKRSREERTKVQQQRLALLQVGQQVKLRAMEAKSQVPAKIAPAKVIAPDKITPTKIEATRATEPSVPATPATPAKPPEKVPPEKTQGKVAQAPVRQEPTPKSMTQKPMAPKPMTEDERRRQERHLALMEERQRMKRERTEMKQRQWELQWQRKQERRQAAQAASGAVEPSQAEEPARTRTQEHKSEKTTPISAAEWPLPLASTFEPSVNI